MSEATREQTSLTKGTVKRKIAPACDHWSCGLCTAPFPFFGSTTHVTLHGRRMPAAGWLIVEILYWHPAKYNEKVLEDGLKLQPVKSAQFVTEPWGC